jgi:hypothetical protein
MQPIVHIQTRFIKINMKITNFICICTKVRAYANEIYYVHIQIKFVIFI